VLLGVWCYAGHRLARQPAVAQAFSSYGYIVVPFVLVALGLYILLESSTFTLLQLSPE
jgi:cadmium resistance protein CadD (predicted permease)